MTAFPDADAFCRAVDAHELFSESASIFVARAPGRLDVMGGIADYSGSLVLELPLAAATLVAVQAVSGTDVVAVSGTRRITVPSTALVDAPPGELARALAGDGGWAAYVLGPIALLAREERKALDGLRVLVSSDVPEGKGVSSSAALELAAVQAAAACLGRSVEPQRLALLAQEAEHRFAGAPCGVMDQMTAACGEAGRLLALLCRPAEILGSIPLPTPLTVWGVDSGVRHAVAGDDYARVRCATFMGKTILGVDPAAYLTELEPSQVDLARLPEQMSGDAYLCSHGPLHEEFSEVEPAWVYPVRAATLHAIEEHLRVRLYAQLLGEPMNDDRARLLGELMFQSHASYSRCGLGCAETDAIVEAVRRLGWSRGLAGARITGGGSGGTVVVLGRQVAEPLVATIATELAAGVVSGSSDGAALFGVRVLRQRS